MLPGNDGGGAKTASRNARLNIFNSILVFLVFHILTGLQSKLAYLYGFEDVPDVTLLARTNYHIPNMSGHVAQLQLTPFHFARYQFYPVVLKLFLSLTFNDSWFALPLVSLCQTIFLSAAFLFMLSRCRLVHNAMISCYLFTFYPVNLILLRHVSLPHSLSFSFVFCASGFFQTERIFIAAVFSLISSLISAEGVICSLALSLSLLLEGWIFHFVMFVVVCSSVLPMSMYVSTFLYADPWSFVKVFAERVNSVPYSSFSLIVKQRPVAFLFGTLLSSFLPSVIGTILLMTVSLPHFLYCLLSLVLLGFLCEKNIERYACGLVTFAVIIGCDQHVNLVLKQFRNWILLLTFEVLVIAAAINLLQYHAAPTQYTEFALTVEKNFAGVL
jgi:hypothetical protein